MGKGLQQMFLERRYTKGQQIHKKCSVSPIIMGMQIQTIKTYHIKACQKGHDQKDKR